MTRFVLLEVAEAAVDEVNVLLASPRSRLLCRRQIEESAGSITANIREGLGRRDGPERNQFYRHSRGSAEETDDRLTRNFVAKRLETKTYWRLHNRLVLIIKMIDKLVGVAPPPSRRRAPRRKRRDKPRQTTQETKRYATRLTP